MTGSLASEKDFTLRVEAMMMCAAASATLKHSQCKSAYKCMMCILGAQLEVDHTVALHLRSRRVGSDEAVYQVTDLFSTLLSRLAKREAPIDPDLHAAHRHAAIEQHIDTAVSVLRASSLASMVTPLALHSTTPSKSHCAQ